MPIKHTYQSATPNDPTKEISSARWNEDHTNPDIADVTGLQVVLDAKQPLATVLTNTTAAFTTTQETKLAGIAAAATANSSDATLLNRANHTGEQAISTVTGLQTALNGKAPSTGINATSIANGTIDNTEFQYLSGVAGNIQSQFSGVTDSLSNKINNGENNNAQTLAIDVTDNNAIALKAMDISAARDEDSIVMTPSGNVGVNFQFRANGDAPLSNFDISGSFGAKCNHVALVRNITEDYYMDNNTFAVNVSCDADGTRYKVYLPPASGEIKNRIVIVYNTDLYETGSILEILDPNSLPINNAGQFFIPSKGAAMFQATVDEFGEYGWSAIKSAAGLNPEDVAGTKTQFNAACTDGDFFFTDEILAVNYGGTGATTAREAQRNLKGVFVLGSSAVPSSVTGTTTETTLATVTIPAGAMGLNGMVRVSSAWSMTSNANNKICRMKFGGVNYSATTFTTNAAIQDMKTIQNRNNAASQVGTTPNFTSFATGSATTVTSTINTNNAVDITFTGQHATGTNTITLERYLVELIIP